MDTNTNQANNGHIRLPSASDEEHYLESVAKEQNLKSLLEDANVKNSFFAEIKTRIYAKINHENIFDHILPRDSKQYSNPSDMAVPFSLRFVLTLAFLSIVFIVLLFAYRVTTPMEALRLTYDGPYAAFVRDFQYYGELKKWVRSTPIFSKTISDENSTNRIATREHVGGLFVRIRDSFWAASPEELRKGFPVLGGGGVSVPISDDNLKRLGTYVCFFEVARDFGTVQEELIDKQKIVRVILNNWPEIGSQIVTIIACFALLVMFMYKKQEAFLVIKALEIHERMFAVRLYERVVEKNYTLRKKFHYLLAIVASAVVLFLHLIFIQRGLYLVGEQNASMFGLVAYDYRMSEYTLAIAAVHWIIQVVMIYFIVLTVCELRQLNICRDQILSMAHKAAWKINTDICSGLENTAKSSNYSILFFFVVSQLLLTGVKISDYMDVFPIGNGVFLPFYLYVCSPLFIVGAFLWVATRAPVPCEVVGAVTTRLRKGGVRIGDVRAVAEELRATNPG